MPHTSARDETSDWAVKSLVIIINPLCGQANAAKVPRVPTAIATGTTRPEIGSLCLLPLYRATAYYIVKTRNAEINCAIKYSQGLGHRPQFVDWPLYCFCPHCSNTIVSFQRSSCYRCSILVSIHIYDWELVWHCRNDFNLIGQCMVVLAPASITTWDGGKVH